MKRIKSNYWQERARINELYDKPKNLRLKYLAILFAAITIILFLCMIYWIDNISLKALLIMRGCAGLSTIVFVVLVGILTYRVNKEHIANRRNNRP